MPSSVIEALKEIHAKLPPNELTPEESGAHQKARMLPVCYAHH